MKSNQLLLLIGFCSLLGCAPRQQQEEIKALAKVKLVTNYGEIVLQLYDETPLHRDNFIKIINNHILDSVLFHRVIQNFMIQAGDINSKHAQPGDTLGDGDLPYTVPAEITTELFHKKGVLAAARDDHPERASSSTQFYIVQGKIFTDSLLDAAETRINGWLAQYYIKHDPAYKNQFDSLNAAFENKDHETFARINTNFRELAKGYSQFDPYKIPEAHRVVYKTIGGTPHLDQNYTVFGEVVSGLEVVDSIAAVQTNSQDRPMMDVRILHIEILEKE